MATITTTVFQCDLCRRKSEPRGPGASVPIGWHSWEQAELNKGDNAMESFAVHVCNNCCKRIIADAPRT